MPLGSLDSRVQVPVYCSWPSLSLTTSHGKIPPNGEPLNLFSLLLLLSLSLLLSLLLLPLLPPLLPPLLLPMLLLLVLSSLPFWLKNPLELSLPKLLFLLFPLLLLLSLSLLLSSDV